MRLQAVEEVIGDYTGLSRQVLDYSLLMKRLVDQAKQPGFTVDDWAPLAAMVDIEAFERVGNFKEVMNWKQYLEFLTAWARTSEWECSFRRVTEAPGRVLLELEERSRVGDFRSVVNSVSVYDFDSSGRLTHLDIYLQMELPPETLPAVYQQSGVVSA